MKTNFGVAFVEWACAFFGWSLMIAFAIQPSIAALYFALMFFLVGSLTGLMYWLVNNPKVVASTVDSVCTAVKFALLLAIAVPMAACELLYRARQSL